MFTIIGGDGKEYGPATVQQIKTWIADGRANLETKAKAVGSDEWRRLGDYAEFAPDGESPSVPPPIPVSDLDAGPHYELADRFARLGAMVVDLVAAFLAALPGFLLLGASFLMELYHAVQRGDFDYTGAVTPRMILGSRLLFLGGLIVLILQLWWLSTRGQTIGKRAMGIKIVRVEDETNAGFVRAVLLRNFVPLIISFIPLVGLIFSITDILFIFRADRRCVHDLIASTKVVKV